MGGYRIMILITILAALIGCEPANPGGNTYITNEGDVYEGDEVTNIFYGDDDDSASVEEDETCEEFTFSGASCQGPLEQVIEVADGDLFQTPGTLGVTQVVHDGRRFPITRGHVMTSWLGDDPCLACEEVKEAPDALLSAIEVREPVRMRPGSAIFTSEDDSTMFLAGECGMRRAILPGVAQELLGEEWGNLLLIKGGAAFEEYPLGAPITSATEVNLEWMRSRTLQEELDCYEAPAVDQASTTVAISTALGLPNMVITTNWGVEGVNVQLTPEVGGGDVVLADPTFVILTNFTPDTGSFTDLQMALNYGSAFYTNPSVELNGPMGPVAVTFEGEEIVLPEGLTTVLTFNVSVPLNSTIPSMSAFQVDFPVQYNWFVNENGLPLTVQQLALLDDTVGAQFTVAANPEGSISTLPPQPYAVPGTVEILRATATAPSSALALAHTVMVDLVWSVTPGETWHTCGQIGDPINWLMTDSGTNMPVSASVTAWSENGSPCSLDPTGVVDAVGFYFTDQIPAGETRTYRIFGDFSGVSLTSAMNDDGVLAGLESLNSPLAQPLYDNWTSF